MRMGLVLSAVALQLLLSPPPLVSAEEGPGPDFVVSQFKCGPIGTNACGSGTADMVNTGMALDSGNGDIVLSLTTQQPGSAFLGYGLVKHSAANGTKLWEFNDPTATGWAGTHMGSGLVAVIPSSGDVVSAGNPGGEYFISKHSGATGARLWLSLGGAGTSSRSCGVAAVPSTGDVVTAGQAYGAFPGYYSSSLMNYFVAKHSGATGARLWVVQAASSAPAGNDYGTAVAVVASTGDVAVVGHTTGAFAGASNLGGADYFVAKHSGATGVLLWRVQHGTADTDAPAAVAVVPSTGDIVVVGHTTGAFPGFDKIAELGNANPGYQYDYYVAMHNGATGAVVWLRQGGCPHLDRATSVTVVGPTGDVVVAGYTSGSVRAQPKISNSLLFISDYFVVAYSTTGDVLWAKQGGVSEGIGYSPQSGIPSMTSVGVSVAADATTGDIVLSSVARGPFPGFRDLTGQTYFFVQAAGPGGGRRVQATSASAAAPAPSGASTGSGDSGCGEASDFTISNGNITHMTISNDTSTIGVRGPLQFKPPGSGGYQADALPCNSTTRGTHRVKFDDVQGDKVEYCLRTSGGTYEWTPS